METNCGQGPGFQETPPRPVANLVQPIMRCIIAIHGVGNHRPGKIQTSIARLLQGSQAKVVEFNWDILTDHRVASVSELFDYLDKLAQNIAAAAHLPFKNPHSKTNGLVGALAHLS